MGLRPGFSLEDLLRAESLEIQGQVRNGMCRFLSAEPTVDDRLLRDDNADLLRAALESIGRMQVGFVEHLTDSLEMAARNWGIPFEISVTVENATGSSAYELSPALIARIAELNTYDIALYRSELARFKSNLAAQRSQGITACGTVNQAAVLRPVPGPSIRISDIAGRDGFYEAEQISVAWISEGGVGSIYFSGEKKLQRIELHLYTASDKYPVEDIRFRLNGRDAKPLSMNFKTHRKYSAFIDISNMTGGINSLRIYQPYAVRVQALNPDSPDTRSIGIAVEGVQFHA